MPFNWSCVKFPDNTLTFIRIYERLLNIFKIIRFVHRPMHLFFCFLVYCGDLSKPKRRATKNEAYTSKFQAVNSDLRPFREKKDHALFDSFFAFGPGPVLTPPLGDCCIFWCRGWFHWIRAAILCKNLESS